MDRPEELANKYLKSKGFHTKYEPLGKSTFPDFEINNSIGIEVRRLNEHYFEGCKPSGLNQKSRPLFDSINAIFTEFTQENPSQNFWVTLELERPFPKLKSIKKELRPILNKLINQEVIEAQTIDVTNGIALELRPKTEITNQVFHAGAIMDFDSGGSVLSNLLENMNYCIQQKAKKASASSNQYKQLWLILINEISYGLDDDGEKYITKNIQKNSIWDKIIILNTLNGKEILTI